MPTRPSVLTDVYFFLDSIFKNLAEAEIIVQDYILDHLCFRVSTFDEYNVYKSEFKKIAQLLHEAEINHRPIATYKLYKPIKYKSRTISCIELPAPKTGKLVSTGWEHVEFVIQESFDEFMSRYPHVQFDTSGIAKPHNPELVLVFQNNVVKFHHLALETAIEHELKTPG